MSGIIGFFSSFDNIPLYLIHLFWFINSFTDEVIFYELGEEVGLLVISIDTELDNFLHLFVPPFVEIRGDQGSDACVSVKVMV